MKHHETYGQRPRKTPSNDLENFLAVIFLLAVGFITGAAITLWVTFNAWYPQ